MSYIYFYSIAFAAYLLFSRSWKDNGYDKWAKEELEIKVDEDQISSDEEER